MIFLTFAHQSGHHLGLVVGDKVLDLTAAWPTGSTAPRDVGELAAAGDAALDIVRGLAKSGSATLARSSLKVLAPIPQPRKNVFCVGRNYKAHIDEGMRAQGKPPAPLPVLPEFFTKPPTAVIAAGDTIPLHANATKQLDYEVELAVIIGKKGVDITADKAFDHVFGYSIINDITGRERPVVQGQGPRPLLPLWADRRARLGAAQCRGFAHLLDGERRASPGQPHQQHDLPDRGDHRASVARPDARTRRHHRHRHPGRRRLCDGAAAVSGRR
jgi:hypothetical protein